MNHGEVNGHVTEKFGVKIHKRFHYHMYFRIVHKD